MKRVATFVGIAACLFAASRASAQTCVGDCNGDGMVAINELITGVNIALGATPLSACPSFDVNGDNMVGINELITAVNNALGSCNVGPIGTERTFTIEPGELLADPSMTGTGLFTTGLGGPNAAMSFSPGPLTLVLGAQDANGVASLALKSDVVLTIEIVDGSHLCFKLLAENSDGSVDCNGGTAYDTKGTQPAGDVGFPFAIETGLGSPSGPGNGNLLVPVLYQIVGGTSPDFNKPCSEITYTNPVQTFPFTTTKATSVKGTLTLEVEGQPFDCARFATPGSGGRLAAPAPATQAPIGDVSNIFRFAEAQ
ncbi:hypothetical protein KF840_21290 [bacterium]|nr:hypothetical protein [bacterium]